MCQASKAAGMPIKPGTLTAKGRETRQRIVAAAAQLMFENGVADTTLEDVRVQAGVSNSQVYHYFADKTALIRAVIEYQTDAVMEPLEPLFARLDTMEGLREWRDFAVARQRELNCRGGCPIASLAANSPRTTRGRGSSSPTASRAGQPGCAQGLRQCTPTAPCARTPTRRRWPSRSWPRCRAGC